MGPFRIKVQFHSSIFCCSDIYIIIYFMTGFQAEMPETMNPCIKNKVMIITWPVVTIFS